MKPNRKDIDNFLVGLEDFLVKNKDDIEFDIEPVFISVFKANIKYRKNLGIYDMKRVLNIPFLEELINIERVGNKGKRKHRTQFFFRKVAYGLKYKKYKDTSYENIFLKMLNKKINKGNGLEKEYIIPEDWFLFLKI